MKRIISTLSFFLLSSITLFSQYQVGHTTITFNDPTRTGGFGSGGGSGRQIQSEIYYPSATNGTDVPVQAGQHPVIVFGHGFAMAWDAYTNLWERYAAKGYILVFPRTEGSLFPAPSHNDFALDLKVAGEKMQLQGATATSLFNGKVKNATVIMGHSMGGGSAVIASASNSNIRGYVGLAPAETDPSAIAAAPNVSVPSLIFSGSADGVTPPDENHLPIYSGLSSGCKTFVSILGGAHCYFANSNFNCDFGEGTSSPNISITRAEQQTRTYQYLDLWLDYLLMDNCDAYLDFMMALNSNPTTIAAQSTCTSVSQPVINESNNVLTSSVSGTSYQWLLNGVDINGANSINYTAVTNGSYVVAVTFENGCTLESTPFIVNSLGLEELAAPINIYPNPTTGVLYLGDGTIGAIDVKIFDLSGRLIFTTSTEYELDLRSLSSGSYLLNAGNQTYRIRIL